MRRVISGLLPDLKVFTVLALALLTMVYYLFYYDPVNYVYMITEDNWAEYSTSVNYAITGILLLFLSFRVKTPLPRVIYLLIGISAVFIAGEEISWGQRLISLPSSLSFIKESNLQGEVTLHNLQMFETVNSKLHSIAAYLILIWSLISIILSLRMQWLKEKVLDIGLPILPMKLLPMFLLVIYFFLFYPTAKADEIGEFFLSIAVMLWAVDLFIGNYGDKQPGKWTFIKGSAGAFLVVAFIVTTLMYVRPGSIGWRMNKTASRDYPSFRMYEQSQVLYEYIYKHPKYILPDTRKNHAAMLLEAEKQAEASNIISQESIENSKK